MQLIVNGSPFHAPDGTRLTSLIGQMQLGERRLAVELNGEIIARSAYGETTLCDGDRVEIVQAIGGG